MTRAFLKLLALYMYQSDGEHLHIFSFFCISMREKDKGNRYTCSVGNFKELSFQILHLGKAAFGIHL